MWSKKGRRRSFRLSSSLYPLPFFSYSQECDAMIPPFRSDSSMSLGKSCVVAIIVNKSRRPVSTCERYDRDGVLVLAAWLTRHRQSQDCEQMRTKSQSTPRLHKTSTKPQALTHAKRFLPGHQRIHAHSLAQPRRLQLALG